jgi:hypothetical protein
MHVVDYFLEKATSQISATQLESGNLELVQAFCLLSNLAQKRNKVNSGSVYLGIAVRMAIGLGLHRELPLWSISPFEREVRYVHCGSLRVCRSIANDAVGGYGG